MMTTENEPTFFTFEQAEAMLPEGETIHTFRNPSGMLVGSDWDRAEILKVLKEHKPQRGGEMSRAMGHGLCVHDGRSYLFIETKKAGLA